MELPESKHGTKSAYYALVLQQLMSVEVDGMEENAEKDLFETIKGSIDQIFQIREIKDEQERKADEILKAQAGGSTGGGVEKVSLNSSVDTGSSNVQKNGQAIGTNISTNGQINDGSVTPSLNQRFASFAESQSQLLTLGDNLGRRGPEVVRLRREFRIDGTVGKGGKDSLSYSSLCYQIQQGKDTGYSPGEIRTAVVRATKQGTLRTYLESLGNVTEDEFLEALQIHYNEKKAFKMLNEMSRCYQNDSQALETNENEVQFCMRMFGYCDQIRKISREEGQPIDEKLIKDTLYSSLSTGFKQGAVRLELQQTLHECQLDNNALLKEVTRVMNKEIEHKNKMESDKKHVAVNEVDVLNGRERFPEERRSVAYDKEGESKEDKMFSALTNLSHQMSELADLTKKRDAEMQELKKKLERCEARLSAQEKKPANKCPTCIAKKARFCPHCLGCGEEGHKKNECPLN